LFKNHREIAYKYVPRADAVFFVLDSVEALISADEIEFLKKIFKQTKKVFFIQTKIDLAGEEQCAAWQERNLDILSKEFSLETDKIAYFPVSSEIKKEADKTSDSIDGDTFGNKIQDLKDSGYLPVINFLKKELIPCKNYIIAEEALKTLIPKVSLKGSQLQDCLRIACEKNETKLEEIETEMQKTLEDIKKWRKGSFQKEIRIFQDNIFDLKRTTRKKLDDALSPTGDEFKSMAAKQLSLLKSTPQVSNEAERIISDYAADCSEKAQRLIDEYRQKFIRHFSETMQKGVEHLDGQILQQVQINPSDAGKFDAGMLDGDALRSGFINGSIAAALVSGGFSLYFGGNVMPIIISAGLFGLTPIGWVVAGTTAAAAILAGCHGYKTVSNKKLQVARAQLKSALADVALNAHKAVTYTIDDAEAQLERYARDSFEKFADSAQEELEIRLKEIRNARHRTMKEGKEAVTDLRLQLSKIKNIHADLNKMNKSLNAVN
jgi:hypothetical protein